MRASILLVILAVSGCRFGEARFESTLPGRAFDPAGTVFSYVDQHNDNLVVEEKPRVAVAFVWIIFDPNGDLNDLEGSALADYAHELKLKDALSLVFDGQSDLEVGARFKSVVRGTQERGDGAMLANVHLAPERLDASSTYGDVIPLAAERTTDVTISAATFTDASQVLAGDIAVTFARTDDDSGVVREGVFTGSFTAPVVAERTAEQNLALLDVADVLDLPLAPRPAEPAP